MLRTINNSLELMDVMPDAEQQKYRMKRYVSGCHFVCCQLSKQIHKDEFVFLFLVGLKRSMISPVFNRKLERKCLSKVISNKINVLFWFSHVRLVYHVCLLHSCAHICLFSTFMSSAVGCFEFVCNIKKLLSLYVFNTFFAYYCHWNKMLHNFKKNQSSFFFGYV